MPNFEQSELEPAAGPSTASTWLQTRRGSRGQKDDDGGGERRRSGQAVQQAGPEPPGAAQAADCATWPEVVTSKPQSTYIPEVQSCASRLPKYCPPPSLHPASVSSPRTKGGGYTLAGRAGVGVNILEDASHRIGLLQSNLSTIQAIWPAAARSTVGQRSWRPHKGPAKRSKHGQERLERRPRCKESPARRPKRTGHKRRAKADKAQEAAKADKALEAAKADKAPEAARADKATEAAKADKAPEAAKADKAPEAVKADKAPEAAKADKAPEAAKADKAPEATKADKAPEAAKADKTLETAIADKAPEAAKAARRQRRLKRTGRQRRPGRKGTSAGRPIWPLGPLVGSLCVKDLKKRESRRKFSESEEWYLTILRHIRANENKKIYCRNSHDSDIAIDFKFYVAHV